MKIVNNITKQTKINTIIKSIVFKTIIDVFLKNKNIDITKNLISINFRQNNLLIKTNKTIIASELIQLNDIIKKDLKEKLSNLWYNDFFEDINFK